MVQAASIQLLQFPATAKAAFPRRRLFMEDAAAAPSLGSHPESWSILDGCWPEDLCLRLCFRMFYVSVSGESLPEAPPPTSSNLEPLSRPNSKHRFKGSNPASPPPTLRQLYEPNPMSISFSTFPLDRLATWVQAHQHHLPFNDKNNSPSPNATAMPRR
ncbi:hypothetical protein V6N12_013563 [Hibiscus sabdariffa]|uniref:Uncharacterized protein n=1 Tax=Hibiscus sabdariffa TaxID=183260 RepID=A0ABR2C9R0_9ROSI